MKKEIEHFEFMCSLNYLHAHQREFSSGSIFIYSISGINCMNLVVKFFRVTENEHFKGDTNIPTKSA